MRHDYGMGALWWWITAASAAAITTTFAEVEVIDDPTTVRAVESWSLDELDIADAISGPLAELYSKRKQQCQDPAFGKLLGKSRVYFRLADAEVDLGGWLSEHASCAADWPMNPPFDLADPQFASNEISREEFERAWERAARHEE